MLPNSSGRATRSSSSRDRDAQLQRNEESKSDNEESDQEDQVAGDVPPADAQAQAAAPPAAAPQAQAGALPPAPMPPPDQVVLSRAAVQQLFAPSSKRENQLSGQEDRDTCSRKFFSLAQGSQWHCILSKMGQISCNEHELHLGPN